MNKWVWGSKHCSERLHLCLAKLYARNLLLTPTAIQA